MASLDIGSTLGTVELEIVQTDELARNAVLNTAKTQLLYVEHVLKVNCIFNPQATSYRSGGLPFPVNVKGELPAITDVAIRNFLIEPRRTVTYRNGDNVVFRAPTTGYTTDAANGPFIENVNVVRIHGAKTWAVSLTIRARIHGCKTVPLVLSHTFRKYSDTDQDYFAMMVTEGEVHFNTARMIREGHYPDDFRRDFFHPIPSDCKREKIEVMPSEDGTSLKYRLIDRETAFHLGRNAHCTRVEAYQTFWWSKVGMLAGTARSFAGRGPGAARGVVGDPLRAPFTALGAIFGSLVDGVVADTPQFYDHIIVRVWGHKEHIRLRMMEDVALPLAFARLGPIGGGKESELIVSHELHGKFVEVQLTHKAGPEGLFAGLIGLGGVLDWRARLTNAFRHESVEERAGLLFARGAIGHPEPPRSAGARGTLAVRLVTQALHDSCSTPAAPPVIAPVTDSRWS